MLTHLHAHRQQLIQPITRILFIQLLFQSAVNMHKENVKFHKNAVVITHTNNFHLSLLFWPGSCDDDDAQPHHGTSKDTVCLHENEFTEMSYTVPLNVKEHTQYNLTNIYLWFEFLQVW